MSYYLSIETLIQLPSIPFRAWTWFFPYGADEKLPHRIKQVGGAGE